MIADTDLFWLLAYGLRRGEVIFTALECVEIKQFYVFLENDSTNLRKFFSEFSRRHLLVIDHYNLLRKILHWAFNPNRSTTIS